MVRPPPIQARRRRSNLVLYLLLNILVSAATTLSVLAIWDAARPGPTDIPVQATIPIFTPAPTQPLPTATLPPLDQPVIKIVSVIGSGDLEQENVVLQRVGTGNLRMVGWQLAGEGEMRYTFPEQPELTLLEGAEIQLFTKPGDDTVTALYWNQSKPAWKSGDTVRILDSEGNLRAEYTVP